VEVIGWCKAKQSYIVVNAKASVCSNTIWKLKWLCYCWYCQQNSCYVFRLIKKNQFLFGWEPVYSAVECINTICTDHWSVLMCVSPSWNGVSMGGWGRSCVGRLCSPTSDKEKQCLSMCRCCRLWWCGQEAKMIAAEAGLQDESLRKKFSLDLELVAETQSDTRVAQLMQYSTVDCELAFSGVAMVHCLPCAPYLIVLWLWNFKRAIKVIWAYDINKSRRLRTEMSQQNPELCFFCPHVSIIF